MAVRGLCLVCPSPRPADTACDAGAEGIGKRGLGTHGHGRPRLPPKPAAGLQEGLGGQGAAGSQDRPPTRRSRRWLSPGPALPGPLALPRNSPPRGLPRGGREDEGLKPGARKSPTSLHAPETLPAQRAGAACPPSAKSGGHWACDEPGSPLLKPRCVSGFDEPERTRTSSVTSHFSN